MRTGSKVGQGVVASGVIEIIATPWLGDNVSRRDRNCLAIALVVGYLYFLRLVDEYGKPFRSTSCESSVHIIAALAPTKCPWVCQGSPKAARGKAKIERVKR